MADGLDLAPTGFSGGVNNADAAVDVYTQQSDTGVINKSGANNNRDSDFSVESLLATPKDFISKAKEAVADVQKQIKDSAVVQEYNRLSGEVKEAIKGAKEIESKVKQTGALIENIRKNGVTDVNGVMALASSIGGVSKSMGYDEGARIATVAVGVIKQATAMGLTGVINTVLSPKSKAIDYLDEITKAVAPSVIGSGDAKIIAELTGAARNGTLKSAMPNIVEKIGRGIKLGDMSVTDAYKQAKQIPAIMTSIEKDWNVIKSPGGIFNSGAVNGLLTKVEKLGGLSDAILTVKNKENPPICTVKDYRGVYTKDEMDIPANTYTPPYGQSTTTVDGNSTITVEDSGKTVVETKMPESTNTSIVVTEPVTPETKIVPTSGGVTVYGKQGQPIVLDNEYTLNEDETIKLGKAFKSGDMSEFFPGEEIITTNSTINDYGNGQYTVLSANKDKGTTSATMFTCVSDPMLITPSCTVTRATRTNTFPDPLTKLDTTTPPEDDIPPTPPDTTL